LLGALGAPGHAQQQVAGSSFNEEFLGIGGDQPHADLSLFSFGNRVLAGTYMVDVSLNERGAGQTEIRFAAKEGRNDAEPCLTRGMLDAWGVNVAVFPELASAADTACIELTKVIPDAAVSYDAGKQRLFVSIPQAALKRSARGAVGPEKWDKGITAGMLDYQLNFARYSGSNYRNDANPFAPPQNVFDGNPFAERDKTLQRNTLFAGLRAGFNFGDWRFRHFSTYNRGLDGKSRWQGISTYVQRDLASINGRLLIGDGNTPGNFFDSLPFRGVQLSSDDAMLPDSQQGYAPTIRGVAQTNARVTVRQNGYVIYSTFVAPGPFVIDDLYPTASSGDLEVTVAEADGRQTRYTQAFSAVPTLLREGTWRYSATIGKYRNNYDGSTVPGGRPSLSQPVFMQATLARGLGNEFSLYGGLLMANMYQSLLAGVGKNLRDFGAVSVDLSAARTTDRTPINGVKTYDGQSVRFLYSKAFLTSGTNFRVAGYRYSTSGYRTFQEAVQMQDLRPFESFNSRRNEVRFEVSQQIGDLGTVFASARQQSYWGTSAKDRAGATGLLGQPQAVRLQRLLQLHHQPEPAGRPPGDVHAEHPARRHPCQRTVRRHPRQHRPRQPAGQRLRLGLRRQPPDLQRDGRCREPGRRQQRQRERELSVAGRALRRRPFAGPRLWPEHLRRVGWRADPWRRRHDVAAARRDRRAGAGAQGRGRGLRVAARRGDRLDRQRDHSQPHAVPAEPPCHPHRRPGRHGGSEERRHRGGAHARRRGGREVRDLGGLPPADGADRPQGPRAAAGLEDRERGGPGGRHRRPRWPGLRDRRRQQRPADRAMGSGQGRPVRRAVQPAR
jgi:hypothetical protein